MQKLIARAGLASRRKAEEWITAGRVRINGRVVTRLGVKIDPETDVVEVDGQVLRRRQEPVYLMLNKPRHCLTTLDDPRGRPTVARLVAHCGQRVFPVGRLDWDAEGLLLLTNDGPLCHRLMHPRFGVAKVYQVKVQGHPRRQTLNRLRHGIHLREGKTAPATVQIIKATKAATWLSITLHQGWYRQIKRMCAAVEHPVLRIKRVAYGPLKLGELAPGRVRPLSKTELDILLREAYRRQD